jgi:hypothetical protein
LGLVEGCEHNCGCHRQLANADAGGVIDGVADGGSSGDDAGGFADA